jgi:hypothetical protein
VWNYVVSLNLDLRFDVNIVLMGSCIRVLKGKPSQDHFNMHERSDYGLVYCALRFAALYEDSCGEACLEYVNAVDQVMGHHRSKAEFGGFMPSESTALSPRKAHWSLSLNDTGGMISHSRYDNFLSAVLSFGLVRYLLEVLSEQPIKVARNADSQVLNHVLKILAKARFNDKMEPLIHDWVEVLHLMLFHGFDANAMGSSQSAWESLLMGRVGLAPDIFDEVVVLFVKAGANVNLSFETAQLPSYLTRGREGSLSALDILTTPTQREVLLAHGAISMQDAQKEETA